MVIFLILLGYSGADQPLYPLSPVLGGKYSELTLFFSVIVGGLIHLLPFFQPSSSPSIYYYLFNDVVSKAFLAR